MTYVRHPSPVEHPIERPERVSAADQAVHAMGFSKDHCPHCAVLLTTPIPEEKRHLHGDATEYRREIGVELDDTDGLLYFVCPDCHGAWPRSFAGLTSGAYVDGLRERAATAIAAHDEAVATFADRDHVEAVLAEHRQIIEFAFGMVGRRWLGWTVAPTMGHRLYLLSEPVVATRLDSDSTKPAVQMVANATGWPTRLLLSISPAAPMVQMMLDKDPNAFTPPPPPRPAGAA